MSEILIVNAPYYKDISDMLLEGAQKVLNTHGMSYDILEVPGALEIPAVIAMASDAFSGFIALGCVIRGETSHYDIVAGESARAIMDLTTHKNLCIGNGILTCENSNQAIVRADPKQNNKGADAANAALALIQIKKRFLK